MSLNRRQFLLFVGGLLAGCGTVQREPDYTVVIEWDNTFYPANLVVPRGSIVAWHNRANHVHTVTADPAKAQSSDQVLLAAGAEAFDSGNIYPGQRWVHTFDVGGDYIYFSQYGQSIEMFGAVSVC
jgi:plastocyanin